MKVKICTKCGEGKPLSEFAKAKGKKDGVRSWCKVCCRKDNLERYHRQDEEKRAAHRWSSRKSQLKLKYGLTVEQYVEMWEAQEGKCKICGDKMASHAEDRHKVACIDHCHTTGKVRGLLCGNCNIGLGKFFDNTERLANAIKYLEENS